MSSHVSWAYNTPPSHDSDMKNQKCCPTSHIFWEFNNKPILLHLDDVITLSFPTKQVI